MEIVGSETYDLPLFDVPLARLTFSPEGIVDRSETPGRDIESGRLELTESLADSGNRNISVVHSQDGEQIGRYRFKVLDDERRICRYYGADDPPWSVYCAVVQYGYYCQTIPESERKYALDLLDAGAVELLQRVQEQEYVYPLGMGLRVFEKLWTYIRFAAIEYQVGAENMEDAVEILSDQGDGGFATAAFDNMKRIFETYEVENAFIPHSLEHPSTAALSDDDSTTENSSNRDTTRSSSEDGNGRWGVVKHRGQGGSGNILFVSIIGSDAIDRFSFQITDEDAGECVVQTGVVDDFPPYSVIDSVREEFEITNIPSFVNGQRDVPFSQFLLDLDTMVRRTTNQLAPESDQTAAVLDDYLNTLNLYLNVVAAYEIAPEEYQEGVSNAFSQLGIALSSENIGKLSHDHLDQISLVAFQALDDESEVKEFARELLAKANTDERRPKDLTEDPDVSLAAQLLDNDTSIYN